jgi:hypothetical protein
VLKLDQSLQDQKTLEIANQIAVLLQGIRFGSVEILIHEGRIVQIERREKLRLDEKSTSKK